MTGLAFYNEHDPYAAAWLRNLIAAGYIAPGVVDERDIRDVRAGDLDGFAQCHFFAGIGVWSYALRLAGWPDDRPVWSASCPCQPISSAGLGLGHVDERHLWPALHGLIAERQPAALFGEQVASKDGREWFSAVRSDLEHMEYACGAADLAAAGVGAPHIRQRIFFVADATEPRRCGRAARNAGANWRAAAEPRRLRDPVGVADPAIARSQGRGPQGGTRSRNEGRAAERGGEAGRMVDAALHGARTGQQPNQQTRDRRPLNRGSSLWSSPDWVSCRDGKARPVEPGSFPLAHGAAARVGRLRAYGNAIVAPLAAEFIGAFLDLEASPAIAMLDAAE